MTRVLVGLVFAPFVAWYAYRAIRALRTGVYDSLGEPVTRAEEPERFWAGVGRLALWTVVMATAGCLAVLGGPIPSPWWALGGYAALYVLMHLAVAFVVRLSRRAS